MKWRIHSNENTDLAIKAIGSVILVYIGKVLVDKYNKNKSESNTDTDPNVGFAQSLRQAMNRSGISWLMNVDGTNTDAIFEIAKQIKNLDDVASEYKKNFTNSLLSDLQKELSPEDYQKFLGLVSNGKVGNQNYGSSRNDIPKDYWVLTSADANVRRKPIYIPKILIPNNIVKTVAKNKLIGATTGKFAFDEKNKVVFVEFWSLVPNKASGKNEKQFFYVAKSQIELLHQTEKQKREAQGKFDLEVLNGIETENQTSLTQSLANEQVHLICKSTTTIYSEKFEKIGTVSKGIILGFPILSLKTNTGEFTKFLTIQGLIRWVDSKQTYTLERGN